MTGLKGAVARIRENWVKRNQPEPLNLRRDIPFAPLVLPTDPFGFTFDTTGFTGSVSHGRRFSLELGDVGNSSIVQAGVTYAGVGLNTARLRIVDLDADGKETEVIEHDALELLKRPNPYMSFAALCQSIAVSVITQATVYLRKIRPQGRIYPPIEQLWYELPGYVRPIVPQDGSAFLNGYEVYRNGRWYPIAEEDIIVIRDGFDPRTRGGRNRTSALIEELFADKKAALYVAQMFANGMLPPVIVGVGDKENAPTPDDIRAVQLRLDQKLSAGNSNALAIPGTLKAVKLSSDVAADYLTKLREIPEGRWCAAQGVSPHSLMLSSGRDASTYNNVSNYLRRDYRNYIVPLQTLIAETLTQDLLSEYGPLMVGGKRRQFAWDYSQTPEMQRDAASNAEWVLKAWDGDVLTRAEAREQLGYRFDESEDDVYKSELKIKGDSVPAPTNRPRLLERPA